MYKNLHTETKLKYASYDKYISPKKKCEKFEKWNHTPSNKKTVELENKHTIHLQLKENIKQNFLMEQEKAKIDSSLIVASFDLQKVLNGPSGDSMLLGYYRKFASYNFTIYETQTKKGVCFLWGQHNGKRGANEICSN